MRGRSSPGISVLNVYGDVSTALRSVTVLPPWSQAYSRTRRVLLSASGLPTVTFTMFLPGINWGRAYMLCWKMVTSSTAPAQASLPFSSKRKV